MERIIAYNNPASLVTEAYRTLSINILAGLGDKKILVVAAVAENTDVSLVIANLAVAMSQAGKNVLIVDCNLRDPKQHELFGLQNYGVTNCITKGELYTTYVQATKQSNLFVLAAGAAANNPAETLLSAPMETILQEAKATYDVVLLDVPPAGGIVDAVSLGTKTDGALLVLTNKKDKVEQAQKAKEMFTQVSVPILGCILNKV